VALSQPLHVRLPPPRTLARLPRVWLNAVAALAGFLLLARTFTVANSTIGPRPPASWLFAWTGWMLMVLAMMLPVIAPGAERVGMLSTWSRRHRAMVTFLCGYLAVWALIGLAVVAALYGTHHPHPPAGVTAASLAGAALWQTSRPRRRIMRRCGSFQLHAARGAAADVDCVAAGWRAGLLGAATCGPVMLAMAVGHHYPMLMVGLVALVLSERARGPNPDRRAGRPLEAWCLLALAAIFAFVSMA
jgi:predicted metal-binding membrane protein